MTAPVVRRCFVSGLVQGVFFRGSTRQRAIELGLSGYAVNLPDGRVEVLIVGEPERAERLIEWLHRGPPAARVNSVEVQELKLEDLPSVPTGFSTG
ncbi:MAG TPA: acylphosphatase [Steroidobacteraceae bacterium]